MATKSPLREVVERSLADQGYDLTKTVKRQRKDGEPWQSIAYWIKDNTGRTVTAETLRRWYKNIT